QGSLGRADEGQRRGPRAEMHSALGHQQAIAAARTAHCFSVGRISGADQSVDGSNMHCNVGLAILVKVGPISDCFDGGTQSVSMVGTPVSLIPRSKASRRSVSSTVAAAWSCRQPQTASGCAQRPIMWGAHNPTKSPRGSGRLVNGGN